MAAPRALRTFNLSLLLGLLGLLGLGSGVGAADPSCKTGIAGEGACCAKECGRCGGQGCGGLPGGAPKCCGGVIKQGHRSCAIANPPCKMAGPSPPACTVQPGIEYLGNDVVPPQPVAGESACCAACAARTACRFFTYEGGERGQCHLKNTDAPDYSRHNATCTSGYPGTSPPASNAPPDVLVMLGEIRAHGGPNHVCWNIDASANRGFFWRNWSATEPTSYGAQLARQAAALGEAQSAGYSLLRFGGSGNDYLTYAFGGTQCPPPSDYKQCLNQTHWASLLSFTKASKSKMVFGLSMNTGRDDNDARDAVTDPDTDASSAGNPTPGFPFPWDPSNARQILRWTIDQGLDHLIFGFELGKSVRLTGMNMRSEQNNKYTGMQQATNFHILYNLTVELWPDPSTRPKLFGPDPHSLHAPTGEQLNWIGDWLNGCKALGVPIYGVTHHEYIEVDPTASGFVSASKYALNGGIAAAINHTVRQHNDLVRIFGGEIGPHNGGSPPCDHSSMRWAVFGDSLWYADALASKARHGYSGLCRQDYIGADYGMVDCQTGMPLPDFYTALLWTRTMGPKVLDVTTTVKGKDGKVLPAETSSIRVYAHCAQGNDEVHQAGGVTLLAINLGTNITTLHLPSGTTDRVLAYVLSPSDVVGSSLTHQGGLLGTNVMLNDQLLALTSDGHAPATTSKLLSAEMGLAVPPISIAFFTLPISYPDCV